MNPSYSRFNLNAGMPLSQRLAKREVGWSEAQVRRGRSVVVQRVPEGEKRDDKAGQQGRKWGLDTAGKRTDGARA